MKKLTQNRKKRIAIIPIDQDEIRAARKKPLPRRNLQQTSSQSIRLSQVISWKIFTNTIKRKSKAERRSRDMIGMRRQTRGMTDKLII